jgi:hypothetical protein
MGVETVDVGSAPLLSRWNEWIRDEIAASDMVLVVLPAKPPDPPAFLVEIGMALGLAKPILILAPEDRPPSDLAGVQYVRASPDDSKALELHLRALVEASAVPRGLRSPPTRRVRAQPDVAAWLARSLQELAAKPELGAQDQARSLETLVAELFRRAGGLVETAEASSADAPDLAVMFDQFPALEGPLLVDVKVRRHGRPPERSALDRLQRYVLERGALLGVLVYWSPAGRLPAPAGTWPLITIDLTHLTEELETQSLPDVLAKERNRAVHGV